MNGRERNVKQHVLTLFLAVFFVGLQYLSHLHVHQNLHQETEPTETQTTCELCLFSGMPFTPSDTPDLPVQLTPKQHPTLLLSIFYTAQITYLRVFVLRHLFRNPLFYWADVAFVGLQFRNSFLVMGEQIPHR